jgi:rhamnosyltransferase
VPRAPSISVVIPVKDGGRYLAEVLAALARQPEPHDVLVVDSGSRDDSVAIARAAGARVHEIAPDEFGHGRTRNLGAELTTGEIICFLTQDATPTEGWLAALLEGFGSDERVGVVYGPQLPRPGTPPMVARELTQFFAAHGAPGDPYLSNVNAAYRRACWAAIRFRDVPYAEDQAFGRDMPAAGWTKVFAPRAAVVHAHDYGLLEFMRRSFDEARGLRETTGWIEQIAPRATLGGIRRLVGRDVRWMRAQRLPLPGRVAWTARSIAHHSGRKLFAWLGSRADRLPRAVRRALSLERRD